MYQVIYLVQGERHRSLRDHQTLDSAYAEVLKFQERGFCAWVE